MAADQRKRRLSAAATSLSYGSQEQYRAKRRDLRSTQCDFSFNSHVSLKWDDNGKRVVAKEEQVGLSWRHLRSFVPTAPCSNTKLADVVRVPRDVFELNDLLGIVSNEAWESLLSEKERGYLLQFLPQGLDSDQVVQALLGGDNFHFGNPSSNWGAKLCSGDLHPDAIVHHERRFKTNKKEYYSELQRYHDSMVRNLQKVKERCARSKDPEAEILQMMSRSRRCYGNDILPDANGIRSLKPEDGVAAISESPSSIPDEKLYYSDNQKLSVIRDAEIQKRVRNDEAIMDKHERLAATTSSLKVSPKLKKAEKLQKTTISNDGAKYMSYVKISKKQHELVKSMKQSGSSIQSRSLNRVLGNLTSFNVKPYEMFVEEEQNRIHEHWSHLANNILPPALQNWRDRQSERKQIMSSLLLELGEKLRLMTMDERLDSYDSHSEAQDEKLDHNGTSHVQSQDENLINPENDEETDSEDVDVDSSQGPSDHQQDDDTAATQGLTASDERDSIPSSAQNDSPIHNPPFAVNQDFHLSTLDNQVSVENVPLNVEVEVHLLPVENQSSANNPTLNVKEEFRPVDLNAGNNVAMELDAMPLDLQVAPQASHNISHPENHSSCITEGIPCSPMKNIWTSIGLPESYRHTVPTTQYASSSEPSFRHPQFLPVQPTSLIGLDSGLREEDTTKDLLNRHSTDHIPFFDPYHNRDRSELLQSLIKRDTYHPMQKTTGLEFNPTGNVLLEPTQFHGHSQKQMALQKTTELEFNPTSSVLLEPTQFHGHSQKQMALQKTTGLEFNPTSSVLLEPTQFHGHSLNQMTMQKKTGLEFNPTSSALLEPSQFQSHSQNQMAPHLRALDNNRPKAPGGSFMNPNIHENIYSDTRYPIQGQQHFQTLNVRDWANNTRLPTPPIQAPQLNHNWFPADSRVHNGGWSSSESTVFSSPNGSSGDQSLYSVLTQCNTLRAQVGPSFIPVGPIEQIISPTNYGAVDIPMTSNNNTGLPQTISPLDYLSGNEAASSLKDTNTGWMNLGNQNPGLQDPSGRPFYKSWNQ